MLPPSASPWPSSWPSCPACWLDELGLQLTFPSLKDDRKGEKTEREGKCGGEAGEEGVRQGGESMVRRR